MAATSTLRPPRPNRLARQLRQLKLGGTALFSIGLLVMIAALAIFAPLITRFDPNDVSLLDRLSPPLAEDRSGNFRLLGTDGLGRDIWSRIAHGARISLLIGLSTVLLGGTLGLILGLLAGYFGGFWEDLIMRGADIQIALPSMVLYIAILSVVGGGLLNIILILGLTGWVNYARVTRGQVLALRNQDFVAAAHAVGLSSWRILARHITPNLLAPVVVIASFDVARNIIVEASLSFLGIGVPPSIPTWGGMLAEGREFLRLAWWPATLPGIALMLLVLAVNVLGDWVRDYLDPRLEAQ